MALVQNYLPGDSHLIDKIVCELKSQGIFDQFRKECIADVDTKPAYQNLRQRVEGSVSGFLNKQKWRPDMNKNHVREMLRKNIYESGFLETGVERIVDQVVNPKINSMFLPKVTEVVYKFLGIERPNSDRTKFERGVSGDANNLLPTDLEAVSPESEVPDKKQDKSNDSQTLDDSSKVDEDESPPFEPIEEQTTYLPAEENSVDSHLSGFSGLISHDSNQSQYTSKPMQIDTSNQDSVISKHSSDGHLSIVMSDDNDMKMEFCDDSHQSKSSKTTDSNPKVFDFGLENSNKSSSSSKQLERKQSEHKQQSDNKVKSHDRHKSKDRRDDKDRKSERDKKDSKEKKERDKSKDIKSSRSSGSTNKDRDSKSNKNKSCNGSSHRSGNSKDKSGSRKESASKERDRSREKSKSSSSREHKSSKSRDEKSRSHSKHHSSKSDRHHSKSSSSSKDKDKKDSKKDKKENKDDHFSSKKRSDRRSTDRDSNDGQSGLKSSSSSFESYFSSSQTQSKSQESSNSNSNTGSGESGAASDAVENEIVNLKTPVRVEDMETVGEIFINTEQVATVPRIKLIKPKFASNIHEARKLMKIRKRLTIIERQNGLELASSGNNGDTYLIQTEFVDEKPKAKKHKPLKIVTPERKVEEIKEVSPPLKSSVVSAASWDALEAKFNQNLDYSTTYYDDPDTPEKINVDKDCLYFDEKASPFTERYSKFMQTYLGKIASEIESSSREKTPPQSDDKVLRENGRKLPVTKKSCKRKLIEYSDAKNNNKKFNNHHIEVHENFPLPLSPAESDNSIDKKSDISESSEKSSKKSEVELSVKLKKTKTQQRYASEDLYKPRPLFSGSRRRTRNLGLD